MYITALVSLLFITMIPIDCKITNFPYTCSIIAHIIAGAYIFMYVKYAAYIINIGLFCVGSFCGT